MEPFSDTIPILVHPTLKNIFGKIVDISKFSTVKFSDDFENSKMEVKMKTQINPLPFMADSSLKK